MIRSLGVASGPLWLDLIFLAVVCILLAKRAWSGARGKFRAHAAESWPTTEARVETFYLVHSDRSGNSAISQLGYVPVLQYSYSVRNERYSGSFNLGTRESNEGSARSTARGWVGEKIRIRYKESDPAVSVWLERDGAPYGVSSTEPYGTDDSIIDPQLNQ
jgi:hypothetical protein